MRRIAPLAVAIACLAGCDRPVRVGAIVSQTGVAGEDGGRIARGFDLAAAEINASGGVRGRPIALSYRDDSTNPDVGLAAARELVEREGVVALLGAVTSPVTLRLAPYCERRRLILISPSATAPEVTSAGEYVFRACPSAEREAASMADLARDLGLDRVSIVAVDSEYGARLSRVFAHRFLDGGGAIDVERTFLENDDTSRRAAVDALVAGSSGAVYLPAYVDDVASILVALRAAGARPLVLGTSAITTDLTRLAGAAAENAVFPSSSFDPDADDAKTHEFVAAYRARYHETPNAYAAYAYDTVKILAVAADRAGSWRSEDLRDALLAIDDYEGATGRMAFDRNGDVVQYPRLFVVRGGDFVPYDRFVENGGSLAIPGR